VGAPTLAEEVYRGVGEHAAPGPGPDCLPQRLPEYGNTHGMGTSRALAHTQEVWTGLPAPEYCQHWTVRAREFGLELGAGWGRRAIPPANIGQICPQWLSPRLVG
jgi:hypothetical protein